VRLNPLLASRGLEVDDLLYGANRVCPSREHEVVADWNMSAKCHVMASYLDFEQPETSRRFAHSYRLEELVGAPKSGASALYWSGVQYQDLRQSPPKTLGWAISEIKSV
jgi:hypothetical protein